PCGTGPVDGGWERAQNFRKVLDVMFGGSPPKVGASIVTVHGSSQGSGASASSNRWYPDYNSQWALGKCVNEDLNPSGRPSYDTGAECCAKSYANQASGVCLSSLPKQSSTLDSSSSDLTPGASLVDAFVSSMTTHARQRSSFIAYNCGSTTDTPLDSLVVDILFDYEVSIDQMSQASHLLPELKTKIMNDLSHSLGCHASSQRNLRRTTEVGVILGYHSAEGSDVVDGEKGSCSEDPGTDGEKCVPVIGHIAAFIQRSASADAVIAAKAVILHGIQDGIASNSYSNLTHNVVYVGEHGNESEQLGNTRSFDDDSTKSRSAPYVAIAIVALAIMFGVVAVLQLKRKAKQKEGDSERDPKNEGMSASTISYTARVSLAYQASEGENSFDGSIHHGESSTPCTVQSDDDMQPITKFCRENSFDGSVHHNESAALPNSTEFQAMPTEQEEQEEGPLQTQCMLDSTTTTGSGDGINADKKGDDKLPLYGSPIRRTVNGDKGADVAMQMEVANHYGDLGNNHGKNDIVNDGGDGSETNDTEMNDDATMRAMEGSQNSGWNEVDETMNESASDGIIEKNDGDDANNITVVVNNLERGSKATCVSGTATATTTAIGYDGDVNKRSHSQDIGATDDGGAEKKSVILDNDDSGNSGKNGDHNIENLELFCDKKSKKNDDRDTSKSALSIEDSNGCPVGLQPGM
ncbi:hypothetical protein ACHAXR_012772, partial [Thalassiosira sp. AJA248-18]